MIDAPRPDDAPTGPPKRVNFPMTARELTALTALAAVGAEVLNGTNLDSPQLISSLYHARRALLVLGFPEQWRALGDRFREIAQREFPTLRFERGK